MKLKGIVTNIRALGEEVKESYIVKKLLREVPPRFLQIASTIEQFRNVEEMSMEEAIGSLKAHEERMKGTTEQTGGQLLLTEEEWQKYENSEGKLLFTREEWLKRNNKGGTETSGSRTRVDNRGRDRVCDKSRIRCFNFQAYGHFAADCQKPKRDKESKQVVNMAQVEDDEPTLLLTEKVIKGEKYGAAK